MAAAYAALLSIMQILDQIKNHPRPPISLDEQQVESLTENVTFLQEFLEVYDKHVGYSTEADALEMRIADAAHAAENVIESHIVDRILADGSSTIHGEDETSSVEFYRDLQRVIDNMELVKKEAMGVREKKKGGEFHQLQANSLTTSVGSSRSTSAGPNRIMVGFDDIQLQLLDKLTIQTSSCEIISIAGMGGMGKTTLAMNIYQNQLVVEHFDCLAWVTISQEYRMSKILVKLLKGVGESNLNNVEDVNELGLNLYQILCGRRYLIILDDVWDFDVWEQLKKFFPDNNNGSRIMITTRLSNLASEISDSHNIHEMSFLDEDNSWKLFCKLVFGEAVDCPLELEGIGKEIVEGCKGLPLSISVVGGLLAKSEQSLEYWEQTAESLNSTVNSEDNDQCLQILYMSYNSLPLHLKPFFLFIGLLHRVEEIPIMLLSTWWVAEGFVKPIRGKSLEEAADEYLTELIDRNLIFISCKDTLDRIIGDCNINVHDLLRDLCLRESRKINFFCYVGERRSLNIKHKIRKICVAGSTLEDAYRLCLESGLHLRSFLLEDDNEIPISSISCCRLLRVALGLELNNLEGIPEHVNLRCISLEDVDEYRIPSSISRFWNLQSLMIFSDESVPIMAPHEIWMMPQLRSVVADLLCLPDPPTDCSIILENLHTLLNVCNFKCSEEVVRRLPNINFLGISYKEVEDYYLNNLVRLQRLQILRIQVKVEIQSLSMSFPHSLKNLYLMGTRVHWDELNTKIGSLSFLQRLVLDREACIGSNWETIEGRFCSLRILEISECIDLECWITDQSTHFPRLESLSLTGLYKLDEIPSSIGDIPTLQLITVQKCSNSVCYSAERIREEQEELENEDLQVQVHRQDEDEDWCIFRQFLDTFAELQQFHFKAMKSQNLCNK